MAFAPGETSRNRRSRQARGCPERWVWRGAVLLLCCGKRPAVIGVLQAHLEIRVAFVHLLVVFAINVKDFAACPVIFTRPLALWSHLITLFLKVNNTAPC